MNPNSTVVRDSFERGDFLTPHPKKFKKDEDNLFPFERFQPKSIKWRSPLVHSPSEQCSRHTNNDATLCFDFNESDFDSKDDTKESNDLSSGTHETSNSSINFNLLENLVKKKNLASSSTTTRKKLQFPLCDQDYINRSDSFNANIKGLEEICDLEYFGLRANSQKDTINSQKDKENNIVRSKPLVGKYYTQLMSSQSKNCKKHSEFNEKSDDGNMSTNFEPEYKTKSNLSSNTFSNPELLCSHGVQYLKPSQNVHACCVQDNVRKPYMPVELGEYPLTTHYGNFANNNSTNNIAYREIPEPTSCSDANEDYLNHSFAYPQDSRLRHGEVVQKPLDSSYFDDGNFAMHSTSHFNGQYPFRDEFFYRHQEIPSRYPSTMDFRYPVLRYTNIDPSFQAFPSDFRCESNYSQNINPRAAQSYQYPMGRIEQNYVNQYIQQPSSFMTCQNDINQKQSMDHLKQTNLYDRERLWNQGEQNYSSRLLQTSYCHKENCHPQFTKCNNNSVFESTNSRQISGNNQSQANQSLLDSNGLSQKNEKFPKTNIANVFVSTPKRKLTHDSKSNTTQNQRASLFKIPHPDPVMMPTPSQRRSNFVSFEERLDNMILPRNHASSSTTTSQTYDPQMGFSTTAYQPNKENLFLTLRSNGRSTM